MKKQTSGLLAFAIVGIYSLWRNRQQIQDFFDHTGVPINLDQTYQRWTQRLKEISTKAQNRSEATRKSA